MLRTLSRKWTAKIFGHQQFETPSSRGSPLFLDTCTSIDVTCGLRSDFFLSHPRGRLGCFRKWWHSSIIEGYTSVNYHGWLENPQSWCYLSGKMGILRKNLLVYRRVRIIESEIHSDRWPCIRIVDVFRSQDHSSLSMSQLQIPLVRKSTNNQIQQFQLFRTSHPYHPSRLFFCQIFSSLITFNNPSQYGLYPWGFFEARCCLLVVSRTSTMWSLHDHGALIH